MPKRSTLPKGMRKVSCGDFIWINITEASKEHLHALKRQFPFLLASDLKELLPPFQRPKLLERDEYLFIVLLFPVYHLDTGEITPTEVDFLVGEDFLVTNHTGVLKVLEILEESATRICLDHGKNTPELLLFHIINALHSSCIPILTKVSNDILVLERNVNRNINEQAMHELLRLKGLIVDFKNVMQGHRQVTKKLEDHAARFFPIPEGAPADYGSLLEQIAEIESFIENDRDTVNALYDSTLSIMQFRTGEATKTLSAMALIVFPTTLVAAIFSMRAEHMPFIGHPLDFWILLGFVSTVMLSTIAFIKAKRWL